MKIILIILLPLISMAYEKWDTDMYIISDRSITVSWACNTFEAGIITHYDVSIVWEDKNQEYPVGTTDVNTCQMVIPQPRAGHFYVKVCSCNYSDCTCATSKDDQLTTAGGYTRGWRLYWKLQPPGPPVIE